MTTTNQAKTISYCIYISLVYIFISCHPVIDSDYPPNLTKAIDLFFIENKNDSVLILLNDEGLINQPRNVIQVKNIFIAAALGELGQIDSAKVVLNKIDSRVLNEIESYYYNTIRGLVEFRLNDFNQFRDITFPLITGQAHDTRCLALNERLLARVMSYYNNYELAIELLNSSSKHFEEVGLSKSIAINEKFLASLYATLGDYEKAIEVSRVALKTLTAEQDRDELFYIYLVAAKTYILMNKPDTARQYIDIALSISDISTDKQKFASAYNFFGEVEKMDGNYIEAINYYNRVLQTGGDYSGYKWLKIEIYIGLAEIYNILKLHDKAEKYSLEALEMLDNNGDFYKKFAAYNELSMSYIYTNPPLVRSSLDSAQANLIKFQNIASVDISEYINSQIALDQTTVHFEKLQEVNKRERIISFIVIISLLTMLLLFYHSCTLMKRVKETSTELVKKNLSHANYVKKIKDDLTSQQNILSQKGSQQLTTGQRRIIIFTEFTQWLEKEKGYLNPDLDLNMAARELGTNRSYLSQSINAQGISFTELVNQFRVREVMSIMEDRDDARNDLTLQELAFEVGFNSKSVFFSTFRKEVGMTPVQFKEHIRFLKITEVEIEN